MVFKNYGSEVILLNAFESERLRCINKELQAVKGTPMNVTQVDK